MSTDGHSGPTPSRRGFLYSLGASLGSVAFSDLLAQEATGPLALKTPHMAPRAKACIFLVMEGGPSHIDTFDPKPKLAELHLQQFRNEGEHFSPMEAGDRYFVQSPYGFRKVGQAGIDMCEHFHHLAEVADELCVYRGCQADSVDHPTALYHLNTGNKFGGDPAIGSWVTYGLGSENQNLPGYIVLAEGAYPQGGSGNWGNGFLPAHYQGTPLRPTGSPILDLHPPAWKTREHQHRNLDVLAELNREHRALHPEHDELEARMANYELAFRMQTEVPGIIDIDGESESIREMYGLDDPRTEPFGRRCLLARRLVEKGVRFVQLFSGGWDSHDYLERSHRARIYSIDKPVTALVKDLKQRGLLEETLIVWLGEFGRSPDNHPRGGGVAIGRDHNAEAQAMFFAGGGVRSGHVIGATDDIGRRAVEVVHPLKDLHVTLLHLLGLDDNRLTYFHGGRFKQLSQTGGHLIEELLA
ncbi:MAG: DUF1501 domain-containing protein [Acidobacteriota bacterium]|nr:DUF1501 domain-containing protein [Acidobacteriota bacterium]